MREILIQQFCEWCYLEGEQKVPATVTWTIGMVGGERNRPELHVVDACEVHAKLITDLATVVHAAPSWRAPDAGKPLPKGKPARPAKPVGNPDDSGLGIVGLFPVVDNPDYVSPRMACPVCAREVTRSAIASHVWNRHRSDEKPPVPTDCPECDYSSDTGQAMGQHLRVHGYDALREALSGVPGYVMPDL